MPMLTAVIKTKNLIWTTKMRSPGVSLIFLTFTLVTCCLAADPLAATVLPQRWVVLARLG
jgi:hypothetical protein